MRSYLLQGCPHELWKRFRLFCIEKESTIAQKLFLLMEEALKKEEEKKESEPWTTG
jgi:hypothetical protein